MFPQNFGRYVLLERIGRGRMTEVFKAKSFGVEGFEKTLVIKRLLPDLAKSERVVSGFVREAKRVVRLSHANVVQVFDLGRVDGEDGPGYFLATEYVAGCDLATLVERLKSAGQRPPIGLCLYVASELAKALDHAHKRRDERMQPLGVLHADLGPRNALLSWEGEVKLGDFAIGRALAGSEHPSKLEYASPELAAGGAAGPESDVFSLGTLLYELVTGSHPFADRDPQRALEYLRNARHAPLASLRPEIAPELGALIERTLQVDPAARGGDAARLYEELLSLAYASGARFGGGELADLIEHYREAPAAPPETLLEQSQRMEASWVGPSPFQSSDSQTMPRARVERSDSREASALVLCFSGSRAVSAATRERARQILMRYGGQVVAESPREISAMFGLSQADSRDTENAVRCALVLTRSLAAADQVPSVGIDAGRLRTRDGRPLPDERTSELSASARRLAQAARGAVVVRAAAAKNLRGLFVLAEPPKGIAPDEALAVAGVRPAREAYGKFVGRKAELRRLGELIAYAGEHGLSVVTLIGEHGSGKTRLLVEMERRIARGGFAIACYLADCAPEGRELPFSAVAAMLRKLCGVLEGDPPDRAAEIEPRLRALGLLDDELHAVLGELGLCESPEARAASLQSAVTRMFASLAEDELHVFAWDGAEAMDDESEQLLAQVAERLDHARALLMFSARPIAEARFRGMPEHHEIVLGDLEPDDVVRLVAARLEIEDVPRDLLDFVSERAGGHPMFIEELLNDAVESGAISLRDRRVTSLRLGGSLSIPRSLSALLGERVRRLPDDERQVLLAAAVLGAPVDVSVLAAMLELSIGRVHELVEPLVKKGLMQRLGPVTLGFRTPLLPEVVLGALEPDLLAAEHQSAAGAYQHVLGVRTEEQAGRIARHLAEAGERDRAAGFFATSGLYSLRVRRLDRAVSDLARALDLADFESRSAEELAEWVAALGRAVRHVRAGERIPELVERLAAHFDAHREIAEELRARTLIDLALVLTGLHHYKDARRLLQRARGGATTRPDLRRSALTAEAEIAIRIGEFKPALEALEQARALGPSHPADEHRLLVATAQALAGAGQIEEAQRSLDEAGRLPAAGDPVLAGERAKIRALIYGFAGDWQRCAAESETAAEQMRRAGLLHEVAVNLHNQGDALLRGGELPRAYATLQASLGCAQSIGSERLVNLNQMLLAYLDALSGTAAAERSLGERIAEAEAQRWTWDVLTGRYLLGRLLAKRGDQEGARRELELTERLAASMDNRLLADDCARALAELG